MHQKPFGGPDPLGKLTALPRPSSLIKGVGPRGRGGEEERGMVKGEEGK